MLLPASSASAAKCSGRAAHCTALTGASPDTALCLGREHLEMVPRMLLHLDTMRVLWLDRRCLQLAFIGLAYVLHLAVHLSR